MEEESREDIEASRSKVLAVGDEAVDCMAVVESGWNNGLEDADVGTSDDGN